MQRRWVTALVVLAVGGGLFAATGPPVQAAGNQCREGALVVSIPAQAPFVRGVMGRQSGRCSCATARLVLASWPAGQPLTTRPSGAAAWSPAAREVSGTQTIATPQTPVSLVPGASAAAGRILMLRHR